MTVTDSETKFVDKAGIDHTIDELKNYVMEQIANIDTGDIDLSDYVTQEQLQSALDALDIDIDLSAYATKEELQQAINDIDLSDYYTKEETYNKEEIDNLIPSVTDGKDGEDGQDGFSPIATVTKEGHTATITITDKNGTTMASISDGKDGTGGGGSGGGEVYSTEEIEVGTWIDGRTIYRKVINVGKLGTVSSGNYGLIREDFSDVNTDTIISMKALLGYSSTRLVVEGGFLNMSLNPSTNISTYVADVTKSQLVFVGDKNFVKLYYGKNYQSYNCTMIIEYVKEQ